MKKTDISAIVITKNEDKMLKGCLSCLGFCAEIIIVDSGSTDKTLAIGKKFGAKICQEKTNNFARKRNLGAEKAQGRWLFYLDADERLGKKLQAEIQQAVAGSRYSAFKLPRLNLFFGKALAHGGWYPDWRTSLIKKEKLVEWFGIIHESPRIDGLVGRLTNHLVHLGHPSISDGFQKSGQWTGLEAKLLAQANHKPVGIANLAYPPLKEFYRRVIANRGFLDGQVGWLEGVIQAFNKFLVYAQLWELQQKKSGRF